MEAIFMSKFVKVQLIKINWWRSDGNVVFHNNFRTTTSSNTRYAQYCCTTVLHIPNIVPFVGTAERKCNDSVQRCVQHWECYVLVGGRVANGLSILILTICFYKCVPWKRSWLQARKDQSDPNKRDSYLQRCDERKEDPKQIRRSVSFPIRFPEIEKTLLLNDNEIALWKWTNYPELSLTFSTTVIFNLNMFIRGNWKKMFLVRRPSWIFSNEQ